MKFKWLAIALSLGFVVALKVTTPINAQESEETEFVCGSWRDIPSTIARTPRGDFVLIQWATDWVENSSQDSNLDPQSRCETVSQNFQKAYDEETLQYITTGFENNQNIICVAKSEQGVCESQLFTLKPGSDPDESLAQLMRLSNNEAAGGDDPLMQSSGSRVYYKFTDLLNKSPLVEE